MGLDMYAMVQKENEEPKELMYWRKVRQIHNFMEYVWRERTGNKTDDFNLVELDLDKPLLDTLKQYLLDPGYHINDTGFFFGDGELSTESIQDTLGFIKTAVEEIEKGNRVFYSSWW